MGALLQFCRLAWLLLLVPLVSALKMDVVAHHGHESKSKERCVRNFVAKDQLVVITAIIDGTKGDGQQLNMHVSAEFWSSKSQANVPLRFVMPSETTITSPRM
jgi:p24 family protein delta-1